MKKFIIFFLVVLILAIGVCLGLYYRKDYLYDYNIKLNGESVVEIPVNSKYEDDGVVVIHNGEEVSDYIVSNNVDTSKLGTYEVVYEIQRVKKVRTVKVIDNEKPIVKLSSSARKFHIKGNELDLNKLIEVSDNYDNDLSDKIEVISDFNANKEGIYNIKYSVSDLSNNESSIETTINVQEKDKDGIPVLMYHWFYDDTKGEKAGTKNSHNYISKTEFEKQVKYLKDNNYYFPTWDELNDYIDGKIDLPKKSVILTDDDCVKSFFTVALPVAQKYEVPITSFCISNKSTWQKYVDEPYLDFQSHTDSMHQRICKTAWDGAVMCSSYDAIYKDIKKSIELLKNDDAFAYPFGHYNDNTIKALKENGIKLAFTINEGNVKKGANKHKLPRVRIASWTTYSAFKKLVQ